MGIGSSFILIIYEMIYAGSALSSAVNVYTLIVSYIIPMISSGYQDLYYQMEIVVL